MKRIALKWGALVAIAAAGVVIAFGGFVAHKPGSAQVVRADNTICTTCVSVAGPATNPVLYPGATASAMPITFTNTTNGPIYVTQLQVNFSNTFPANCPASNFAVSDLTPAASVSTSGSTTTVSYSPAQTIPAGATWTDSAATLAMPDSNTSQDGCQRLALSMNYTASANYTVLTMTKLGTTSNPSADTATLSATIGPDIQPASAGHTPGPGDGTVTFYSCSDNTSASSCTTSLGSATPNVSGVATLSIPAGSVGSYNLEAVYSPPGGSTNFVGSTSQVVTDSLSGCVNAQTAGAATILRGGQTYSGNYTVSSGSSLWLDGGTINGNVTVLGNGQFAATGGTVNGNVQSSGGPIAMAGTTVTGNVQQQNGGLAIGPTTLIKGNAQDIGGGPVCAQGGSGQGQVQVKGNFTVQSLGSNTTSSICNTTVGNNLQWQNNSSPGLIGSCGGDTILGNLLVQNNSGPVTIGASGNPNVVSGNVNVSGNTGGGTITANKVSGNCQLTGDTPGIAGSANTTGKGQNSCNTTAAGA